MTKPPAQVRVISLSTLMCTLSLTLSTTISTITNSIGTIPPPLPNYCPTPSHRHYPHGPPCNCVGQPLPPHLLQPFPRALSTSPTTGLAPTPPPETASSPEPL
ncbi:unnamed protein product [Cuscuta europaea]|uniref:Uncharacterized protein n=1 Tax=Cuscuta europaea TaxID=41803 RepID=A0A9P1E029_CUSEU|nr:unnamed protein product [Cuscuta europaea]